jgi:asparagine N-glycosylation enzyme membrane subunit Stt3
MAISLVLGMSISARILSTSSQYYLEVNLSVVTGAFTVISVYYIEKYLGDHKTSILAALKY